MRAEALASLSEFLRIPSVSADPALRGEVRQAAEWVARFIREAGGTAEVLETERHPLVEGELSASRPARYSLLLYGHYDVQPAGDPQLWDSPPFEPAVRGEWIYARGAADDKGPFFALLTAAAELARAGELGVDVRILADGEEEILGRSVVDHIARLDPVPDGCLILDGPMPRRGTPGFVVGTRGLLGLRIRVRTGKADLHSGFFGGAAMNAAEVLTRMLVHARSRWYAITDSVSVQPGGGPELGRLPAGEDVLAASGAIPADDRAANEFYDRTWGLPALDINGIHAGEANLEQTVIPVEAVASLSVRLVPGQDPSEVESTLRGFLEDVAPPRAQLEVATWSRVPAATVAPDSRLVRIGMEAFGETFGARPLLLRSGGTLPVLGALADRRIPTILSGIDLHEGNAHGPNERLLVEYIDLGIAAAKGVLRKFATAYSGPIPGDHVGEEVGHLQDP